MTGCIFHDDNGVQCERDPGHKGKHAYDLAMGGQHEWTGGLVPAARIAELERAAETSRAEHAAALKRAEGAERVASMGRTLVEGARESEHMARAALEQSQDALGLATARIRELEDELGELLELVLEVPSNGTVSVDWFAVRRAIVARIEKATK